MPKVQTPDKALEGRFREFIHYSELKHLAYNIAALQQETKFTSLAVLSFFPGEGKTLFTAAIAMAYAETCRAKALIVDTTTLQNKGSLSLKSCFNGSTPQVDVMSLDELRKSSTAFLPPSTSKLRAEAEPVLDAEVVSGRPTYVPMSGENDFALIKRIAEDRSKQYGLIILDTAAIQTKNRNNVDALLVARLSSASVLVASRALLDSSRLSASIKALQDPTLHLIGMISNEGYTP